MKTNAYQEQKETVIEAELFYKENGYMKCCLLGEDGKLYLYNNAQHHVRPFSQKGKLEMKCEPSKLEWILQNSIREDK